MSTEAPSPLPIVFIHGMWMTPLSWEHWIERYRARGLKVHAPAWPGLEGDIEALRRDPAPLRGYKNPDRAPLLLVTGAEDRICPPSVNKANFGHQKKAPSATDHKESPGRCHFPGQDGREEVADFILDWTTSHARATA